MKFGLEVQKDIEFDICWQDYIFILQDLDDIVNQAREAQELEPVDVFFADDKILQKQFRQTAIFNRYLYNFFYDLHLISVYKCIRIREIHLPYFVLTCIFYSVVLFQTHHSMLFVAMLISPDIVVSHCF